MAQSTDILVNTYTTGKQYGVETISLQDGGWLAVWSGQGPGDTSDIFQRRYSADGFAAGDEVKVNSHSGGQAAASVALLDDGGWVVTWSGANTDDTNGITQQRYDKNGLAVGTEVTVNTTTADYQEASQVTALADGGWLVVWQSYTGETNGWDVFMQRYGVDGKAAGTETRVNTDQAADQLYASVTTLDDGGWVISWENLDLDALTSGIAQQRFDKNGALQNTDEPFSSFADEQQAGQVTALADGGWIITVDARFTEDDAFRAGDYMQRYDAAGHTVGAASAVSNYGQGEQSNTQIAALADGGWVAIWSGEGEGDADGVYFQHFDADGKRVGDETQVNSVVEGPQIGTAINALADGGWVIAWSSYEQQNEPDIYQKRYDADGHEVTAASPPEAASKTVKLVEDRSYAFKEPVFGYSDADGDALDFMTLSSLPSRGTLKLNGASVDAGDHISSADLGDLTFTPDKNQIGKSAFKFTVTDESGATSEETYTFTFSIKDVVDKFAGKGGKDTLTGTEGRDILDGKAGNDSLTGQQGADKFLFKTGYDKDTITDFTAKGAGHDLIDLSSVKSITSYEDLKAHHMSASNGDVIVNAGHGDTLTIKDMTIQSLTEGDFLF